MTGEEFRYTAPSPEEKEEIPHPSSSEAPGPEAPIPNRTNPLYKSLKKENTGSLERIGVAKGMARKSERPIRTTTPQSLLLALL